MKVQNSFLLILPLFMAIFIDTLSGSILVPLLPSLFLNSPDSIVTAAASSTLRYFLFGLTQAIVFIAMIFSAPIMGDLSDRIGRKKILIIALLGTFLGYLLTVIALLVRSVSILLLGRLIVGVTAGSVSAAKAAIIDISNDEARTKNIGYILLAVSLGSILGPLLSGFLSNSEWVSWFHLTTPLYFAACLSLLNVIYLHFSYKDAFIPTSHRISLLAGMTALDPRQITPRLRGLTVAFLFMQLGWATFIQFIPLFLTLQYQFAAHEIGTFMACVGIGFTLAFCYLLNWVSAHFTLRHIALVAIAVIIICIFFLVITNEKITAWLLSIPAATSLAISYSVLISLFSEAVDKTKQGWVMGLTGSISALAFGVSGLIAGLLVDIDPSAPLWLSLGLLLISIIAVFLNQESTHAN